MSVLCDMKLSRFFPQGRTLIETCEIIYTGFQFILFVLTPECELGVFGI